MLINKTVLPLLFLITILGSPLPAYAHDPAGWERFGYAILLSVIIAIVFLCFAIKFSLRKTNAFFGVIKSVLVSPVVMVLVCIVLYTSFTRPYLMTLIFATPFLYFAIKFSLKKTEGKNKQTRVILIIISVLFSYGLALLLNKYIVHPSSMKISILEFHNGTHVQVQERYFTPISILVFPRKFDRTEMSKVQWIKNGNPYTRETWFIPIIINEIERIPYIVEFDRETDFSKITFWFYRFDGKSWEEIEYTEFPKAIAKQNMWLNEENWRVVQIMDPKDERFRRSLTGILWILLETGVQYYEYHRANIGDPEVFFSDFIEKHMKK
ncbi:MAG: hypothetical protein QME90_11830 [Thermodesulfobacteriota bacterium]|nr:hypothetical protein [Thermodesulfobacteriota bacterium]